MLLSYKYFHRKKVIAIEQFFIAENIVKLEVRSIIKRWEYHLNTTARKMSPLCFRISKL